MFSKDDLKKRFKLRGDSAEDDAEALSAIALAGVAHGLSDRKFASKADFYDIIGLEIEQTAHLLLMTVKPVRRLYDEAVAAGLAERASRSG